MLFSPGFGSGSGFHYSDLLGLFDHTPAETHPARVGPLVDDVERSRYSEGLEG